MSQLTWDQLKSEVDAKLEEEGIPQDVPIVYIELHAPFAGSIGVDIMAGKGIAVGSDSDT